MFTNTELCSKKIILVTGMTRSGKTLLCPIISSLKNCEQFFFSTIVENISVMHYMKKINFNTSDYIIKKVINENIQDKLLGRNLNTKKNDFTSINNYKNKKIYLKRVSSTKNKNFENSNEFKKNFFPVLFHEALLNLNLLEKSLNKPKIINISRHPVDLILSWVKKKYGDQHYSTKTNTVCTYNYNSKQLPFFCLGIENDIMKQKTTEDRILLMIFNMNKIFKKNYYKTKNKEKIILIKYDSFVSNPYKNLDYICKKFKLTKTNFLKDVLKEQKCPRSINLDKRNNDYKIIISKLSNKNKIIFKKMIHEYESNIITF